MKILLDGYLDRNLGDDLMLELAAKSLPEHDIYMKKNRFLPINALELSDKTDIDVKLSITGSGFLLRDYESVIYRAKDIISDNFKYKRAVLSCNISEFPNKAAEYLILKQLSRLDFITVRDTYSYEYIKKKLPDLKCECYPDIVFSLPEGSVAERENEGALGISAYNRFGVTAVENDREFAKTADEYIEKTGNKVLIFALDTGLENDLKTARSIRSMMKNQEHTEIIEHKDMLANIKRCEKLIGIRFHSIVIAICAGVPVIPIAYSDKTRHMLRDLKFSEEIFNLENIDFNALLDKTLSPLDAFELDKSVISNASMHIKRFKEVMLG